MALPLTVNDILLRSGQGLYNFVPGGLVTAPALGDVMVDSGVIQTNQGAAYLVQVMGWSDTACAYDLERRDAANANTVTHANGNPIRQRFALQANASDLPTLGAKMIVGFGERVRVTIQSAGVAHCMFALSIVEVMSTP